MSEVERARAWLGVLFHRLRGTEWEGHPVALARLWAAIHMAVRRLDLAEERARGGR